jgi:ribonuclease J
MEFSSKKFRNDLLFIPLGGSGEIGMNLNLYHLDGKFLMVDLGAGFADDHYPGVDVVVPDIKFIKERKKDLLGVVLTHAHEDHLGAVGYLIEELDCPIYATKFTANFLRIKLKDICPSYKPNLIIIDEDSSFVLGPFSLELVTLTHSTPEMQALMIRTVHGNVFHTGDWKFDPNPMLGKNYSVERLKKLGEEGVLAVVGDSTNVFNEKPSGSEGDLRESLCNLIASCSKMVMVTTFASNVARLESLVIAGHRAGRKVGLVGRSLWRIYQAAKESGYFEDLPNVYEDRDIVKFPRDKVLIISTGCQGEPMAATNKVANGTHPLIHLSRGDTVIFSSKIIPGNEKRIFRLFNKLVHVGAEVFTERDHFVHVSGHPSSSELREMYNYLQPRIVVPVHGELVHMHEHVRIAKEMGIQHAAQIENGHVLRLSKEGPEIVAKVQSGYYVVDGNTIISAQSPVISMRRKMQKDGIVIAYLVMEDHTKLVARPKLKTPGLLDQDLDSELIKEIEEDLGKEIEMHYTKIPSNKRKKDLLVSIIRQVIRRNIKYYLGKSPVIDFYIHNL